MVAYVIENLVEGGYYDSTMDEFRGIIYSTRYPDPPSAMQRVNKFTEGIFTLKKVIEKN